MEENLQKKENEITSMNNNSNNKNGLIAVLVVIIIALIGAVIYFAFIKKNDKPVDNNENNQQVNNTEGKINSQELKVEKIEFFYGEPDEQEITLNNKKVKIKKVLEGSDEVLYVNNVKVKLESLMYTSMDIYNTGNLLLISGIGLCGTRFQKAVDENGNVFNIVNEYSKEYADDGEDYYYLDGDSMKVENGKIVAEIGHFDDCLCEAPGDYCERNYHGKEKVEFVYDGSSVIIKKVAS